MVQAAIQEAVGKYVFKFFVPFSGLRTIISDKIALNVNADEAAVLGPGKPAAHSHCSCLELNNNNKTFQVLLSTVQASAENSNTKILKSEREG